MIKEYDVVQSMMPIQDRRIRVGLVGCGRVAQNHLEAIEQLEDLELTGICDRDAKVVGALAKRYQAQAFGQIAQLLQTNIDVVVLCTPSGLHAQQTMVSAEAGKHVIVEKPMATCWQDGLAMVRACDKANVHLFVVKQNRFNPTLSILKRSIDSGRFGKIYMVAVNVFWHRPQAYYDLSQWRGTWEFDGGAFMNQACHYIDLLHWLIGPIDSVQARTATLARAIQAEDSGVVNLQWRHGALGSVAVTMLTYPDNLEGSITILGEKGTARLGGVALNEIQHWSFADTHADDGAIAETSYATTSVYGFGHPLYYQNVIEVLKGQSTPAVSGREGLRTLELLTAIYRSARDRSTVYLPLERS